MKRQGSALLQMEEMVIPLEWLNVQKQPKGIDCGPFANAFITMLCHDCQKPEDFTFYVMKMRWHLHLHWFEVGMPKTNLPIILKILC